MPKVRVYYETTKGVYKWLKKTAKDDEIKITKDKVVKLIDPQQGDKVRPHMVMEKTFLGRLTGLPFWTIIPAYKATFKHSSVVPFGETSVGTMNMKMYSEMRKEDVIHELLKPEQDNKEKIIMYVVMALLGAFAMYFITGGGLSALGAG